MFDSFGEATVRCTAYAWSAVENYGGAKTAVKEAVYSVIRRLGAEPSARRVRVDMPAALPEGVSGSFSAPSAANCSKPSAGDAAGEVNDD